MNPAVSTLLENHILPELIPFLRKFQRLLQKRGVIPTRWFVYGSFVRGTARRSSDIDVGIVLPGSIGFSEFYEARDRFMGKRGKRICGYSVEITAYDDLYPEWHDSVRELQI